MPRIASLGRLLRDSRKSRGLSQADLAWQVSRAIDQRLERSYIARLEDDVIARPNKDRLRAIAEELGLPVADVFRLADYNTESEADSSRGIGPDLLARIASLSPLAQDMLLDFIPLAERMAQRVEQAPALARAAEDAPEYAAESSV